MRFSPNFTPQVQLKQRDAPARPSGPPATRPDVNIRNCTSRRKCASTCGCISKYRDGRLHQHAPTRPVWTLHYSQGWSPRLRHCSDSEYHRCLPCVSCRCRPMYHRSAQKTILDQEMTCHNVICKNC